MSTLGRILIANRGEIFIRIARTCHAMGIAPVAIFAGDDRASPHISATDESMSIGPSYRDSARIIQAAKTTGADADAIHPGYGFLSEEADFAEACEQASLVFIGPTSGVIRQMNSKATARALAEGCGIPVVPAFDPGGKIDFPFQTNGTALPKETPTTSNAKSLSPTAHAAPLASNLGLSRRNRLAKNVSFGMNRRPGHRHSNLRRQRFPLAERWL